MKAKIKFLILLTVIFVSRAQSQQCGSTTDYLDTARLLKNITNNSSENINKRLDEVYIPIQFHIVRDDAGFGGIPESRILDAMCTINKEFEPLNMRFYIADDFIYSNASLIHEQATNNSGFAISFFQANKVDNAINVFIGSTLSSGNSGYYSRSSDVIYMDKFYMTKKDIILSHELGHYFSLRHTFSGWEDTVYDPSQPTPTEVSIGTTTYLVEYVDRSRNCEFAGDLICDTPADYILSWFGSCNYTGGAVDPDGVLIDPEEKNIMSYFSFNGCTEYLFSETQKGIMTQDYESRSDLKINAPTTTESVIAVANLLSPAADETVPFDNIILNWSEVENAVFYKLEISRLESFSVLSSTIITSNTAAEIDNLQNNKTYYWRVSAFNQIDFCETLNSASRKFKTSETVSNSQTLAQEISIFPNPVRNSNIYIRGLKPGMLYTYELFTTEGKSLITSEISKQGFINTKLLIPGIYLIKIQEGEQYLIHKFLKL